VNEVREAGVFTEESMRRISERIYFYTLRTNNFSATKKMLLVK